MVYAILAVVRDCRLTRGLHPCVQCHFVMMRTHNGGEKDPVIFPAFKAGDSALRGSNGGFDFHTPPPQTEGAASRQNDEIIGSGCGGSRIECHGYDYSCAGVPVERIESGVPVGPCSARRAGGVGRRCLRALGATYALRGESW